MSSRRWSMPLVCGEWRRGSSRYSVSWLPVPPSDAAAPHPPRHAVQSLYNSPRLPRPRTVNYIANIYSRKLRNTRVECLHSSTVRSQTVFPRQTLHSSPHHDIRPMHSCLHSLVFSPSRPGCPRYPFIRRYFYS